MDDAEARLSAAIEKYPQQADYFISRAMLFQKQGDSNRAMAAYDRAIELDPDKYRAFRERGECYLAKGDCDRALADFSKCIELTPESSYQYKRRADALFHLNRFDEALADIAKAVELNPTDTTNLSWIPLSEVAACPSESFRKGVLRLADKTVEASPGLKQAYVARARLREKLGQVEGALADLSKAVELAPRDGDLSAWRAKIYMELEQYDEAIADFSEAIRQQPDRNTNWFHRAEAYAEQSRWREAADDFSRATLYEPVGWYRSALARLAHDVAGYRATCTRMLKYRAQMGNPDALHWLAWTCALAPDAIPDLSVAVSLAAEAVESDPESIANRAALGAILYRAARFEEAVERLTEADKLTEEPDTAATSSPAYNWYFLAMAHHKLGHDAEAKKWLNKANDWTDKALAEHEEGTATVAWNRRLTLKLFREEAEGTTGKDD
jgi:tetratricopeptide (TPR) repeat protein